MSVTGIEFLKKCECDLEHKRWSGGITTQLAIWPQDGDYAARKFDWRISSAVVEDEESVFTSLKGVHRHIMVIDGGITLTHKGIRTKEMKPMADVDEFEGDWTTSSVGRCTDFNLMVKKGFAGKMFAMRTGENTDLPQGDFVRCWTGIYCVADHICVSVKNNGDCENFDLRRGDFLLISYTPSESGEISVVLKSDKDVPAVAAEVWQEK
ncbi:MAG: HutD family protein [Synergistes sp.]|nr:HutD family protein [Synergistes sp.]